MPILSGADTGDTVWALASVTIGPAAAAAARARVKTAG